MDARDLIVSRIAVELNAGDVVNLGIGMPTEVMKFIPESVKVILQSENGIIDMGVPPAENEVNPNVINAGGKPASVNLGGSFIDSATSFGLIRGGHVDVCVLGAFEVDQEGNLANWKMPGRIAGMGGAMDLVCGAKKVIIAMEHCSKDGKPKILKKCTLPLTAKGKVSMIITEKAVMRVTTEGLVLDEIQPGSSLEDIMASTEADLIIPDEIGESVA
ncbi:MAG: 3-oxoacid CoA-transferase subunit B [Acidobacteriota bacterium]